MATSRMFRWIVVIIACSTAIASVNAGPQERETKEREAEELGAEELGAEELVAEERRSRGGKGSGGRKGKKWTGKTGNLNNLGGDGTGSTTLKLLAKEAIEDAINEIMDWDEDIYDKKEITCFWDDWKARDAKANEQGTSNCRFSQTQKGSYSSLFSQKKWWCTLTPYNCKGGCRASNDVRQGGQLGCPEGFLSEANTICCNLLNEFKDMTPMVTWGSMDSQGIQSWKNNECNDVVGGREKKYCPIGCKSNQCYCVSTGLNNCGKNADEQCDRDECYDRTGCPGNGYWCSDDVSYNCLASTYCKSRRGKEVSGDEDNIRIQCDNDPLCLGYDYAAEFNYGHLCDSLATDKYSQYKMCVKPESNCLVNGDYYGNDLNHCGDKTDTATQCQDLCQKTAGCVQFSWLDKNFDGGKMYKACCMKNKINNNLTPNSGIISGPKRCG